MWLLTLLACWEPTETTSHGMVGVLRGADGAPVKGVLVSSLESEQTTGPEGKFAVQYKPPDQFAGFHKGDAWYQRLYREADDHKVLELRLPETRDVNLVCELAPCAATLSWDLGDGLSARTTADCAPGAKRQLNQLPAGLPTAVCKVDGTPVALTVVDEGTTLTLRPPDAALHIEIQTDEGSPPQSCSVDVGGRVALSEGEGLFSGAAYGRTVITANCDGRPAFPKVLDRATDSTVVVEWSPDGPSVDLGALPVLEGLRLVLDGPQGWSLPLASGPAGVVELPPLPMGRYRLVTAGIVPLESPPEGLEPGVLRGKLSEAGFVGYLRLDEDLPSGKIPVVGL